MAAAVGKSRRRGRKRERERGSTVEVRNCWTIEGELRAGDSKDRYLESFRAVCGLLAAALDKATASRNT